MFQSATSRCENLSMYLSLFDSEDACEVRTELRLDNYAGLRSAILWFLAQLHGRPRSSRGFPVIRSKIWHSTTFWCCTRAEAVRKARRFNHQNWKKTIPIPTGLELCRVTV